jgi:hypothetical protein
MYPARPVGPWQNGTSRKARQIDPIVDDLHLLTTYTLNLQDNIRCVPRDASYDIGQAGRQSVVENLSPILRIITAMLGVYQSHSGTQHTAGQRSNNVGSWIMSMQNVYRPSPEPTRYRSG